MGRKKNPKPSEAPNQAQAAQPQQPNPQQQRQGQQQPTTSRAQPPAEAWPQQRAQQQPPTRALPPGFPEPTASRAQPPAEPVPQQSAWGTPQNVLGSAQPQPSGAVPKAKSKNKYPKKEVERPSTAPTVSSEQAARDTHESVSASALPDSMAGLSVSPTKTLSKIESSHNGAVYEGTRGRKCTLEVNYLELLVDKLIPKAYHYDIAFDPDASKKMWPKAVDTLMANHFPGTHFAFDGRKNVYTNELLKIGEKFTQEIEAVLGDRSRKFKITLQFAAEVDLQVLKSYKNAALQHNDKPSQAIQCLDIILRTAFKTFTNNNSAVSVGRALYFANARPIVLGEGMELWLGLFQSAILGRQALYLNVDVAHKAFPSAVPLLKVLEELNRGQVPTRLDERQTRQLSEYLKMLSVSYQTNAQDPPKTFGFNALVKSAREALFVGDDGKKMSVEQYFKTQKKIALRYPDLPCLHVGSRTRNIYLPIELCSIPAGQATNKKCTPNAVAAMIKYSATSTDDRKRKITELLNKINYSQQGNDIAGFGINVDKQFQKVGGRVIDPPLIQYQRGKATPRNGVWDDRGQKFIETQAQPIKWGIINCDNRTTGQQVNELQRNILNKAQQQGMNLSQFDMTRDYATFNMMRCKDQDITKLLDDFNKDMYKLIFVIIIDQMDCYAKFKQAAELRVGILTQCIKANTIFRMGKGNPMMTIGNILLKVNAKLGGFNHQVIETSYQTQNSKASGIMFVGADVTHPGPDCRDLPSVVGVAASYDDVGFKYNCAWRLQQPTQEMIIDLANILVTQLMFYKQKNGRLPGKIMYYRDGVSDGQFTQVLDIEMDGIRKAMTRAYGPDANKHAKVTFVVVQKRHHTRFFPTQKEFSDGRNNNIPAGTVVDKDIVHPFQYQFFMASHAAIQGVTKPAKYCVLVNETKISPDDLQAITYDLCHLFTRCNRSVSYPAPTYYAHLVAARGKNYTIGAKLDMKNLQREYDSRVIRQEIVNNNPMFFV